MTNAPIADWAATFERYRTAQRALLVELHSNDGTRNVRPVLPELNEAHVRAGEALLNVPARALTHIVVKIRVAEDLFQISQLHPELVTILVNDLLSLAGSDVPNDAFTVSQH